MAGYMTKLKGYVYEGEYNADGNIKNGAFALINSSNKVEPVTTAKDTILRVIGLNGPFGMAGMSLLVVKQGANPIYLVENLRQDDYTGTYDERMAGVVDGDKVRMHRLLAGEEFIVSSDVISPTGFVVGDWLYAGEAGLQIPGMVVTKTVTKVVDTSEAQDITGAGLATFVLAEGDVIHYSVTVENTGDIPLTAISVADPMNEATPVVIETLAVGATSTPVTYTHVVTALEDGTVVENTATATATHPRRPAVTITASGPATIGVLAVPSMAVAKTIVKVVDTSESADITGAALDTFVLAEGDVIHYSVTVENTGDLALADISLADDMNSGSPATIATLAIGATSAATTYTHTVTALEAGTAVENTATATAQHPRDSEVTLTASDTATVGYVAP